MRKIFISAFCFMLVGVFAFHAFSENSSKDSYSWYIKRNSEHKQPIVGQDIAFAEQMGAYYVDRNHGDENDKKVLYLTFDCGYENGNVERILDTLNEKQVKGAFFILSNLVIMETDLVNRMAEEGHLVCNHTSKHTNMSTCKTEEEFREPMCKLEDTYREYTGRELAKYFRPPEGRFNESTLEYADQMGYTTVFWSFAYEDWSDDKQPDHDVAKRKIFDNLHNGAIILLHPTSDTNAAILGDVIDECRAQGYRFATLDELKKE